MKLLNRLQFPALVGTMFILIVLSSCEEDLTTIGGDVVGETPFTTDKEVYDVFAYNNNINAVQTNKLSVYQLGVFNDPIYGKTEAQITSQIQLSTENPTFGINTQEDEDSADTNTTVTVIEENETIKEVYLYIPYLTKTSSEDTDGDGVIDAYDKVIDADNDNDNDGRTNNEERTAGTDPLDPSSVDADLDGINDIEPKEEIIANNFAVRVELDSIYGDREASFNVIVKRSTFFLRDFDADTNFTEAEEYYSTQEFSPAFTGEELANEEETVSDYQILIPQDDDTSTADVDESKQNTKLAPGIRIPLDNAFFQDNILNKEGSTELISQANFKEYIRGLHISLTSNGNDIMPLLNLAQGNITMTYTYNSVNTNSTTDTSDDEIEVKEKDFVFSFVGTDFSGNAVNTFINENYPVEVLDALNAPEQDAEKIYLKGGAGAYAKIKLFNEENTTELIKEIKENNWIINEAKLVFYTDENASSNSSDIKPPRLYLFNTEDNTPIYNPLTENSPNPNSPFGKNLNFDGFLEETTSGDKYTVRVTDYINSIVNDEVNPTLGLMISPDIGIIRALNTQVNGEEIELPIAPTISPLGTVLYGSNVSSENIGKKLQLEIFYTKTN
ncbi:DUF4270 domain-containing protein [uncultured Maribacter sp.]|uniref:DUF4270 domain-containing protein n=1 Tax=uncultured Maribacter sp. TaxID=431308 RepID=UPI00262260D7|nr:DUF4270 domain-containing protein [uncultured Maribacter sp.]